MQTERRVVPAHVKLTDGESEELNEFVRFCKKNGISEATRSSAIRAFILDGLEAFRESREEGLVT